jgi:hypothetical protein
MHRSGRPDPRRVVLPTTAAVAVGAEALAMHVGVVGQSAAIRVLVLVVLSSAPVVVVLLPGLGALAVLGRRLDAPVLRLTTLLVASGTAGMLVFWVAFLSPAAGTALGAAVAIASIAALALPGAWDAVIDPDVLAPVALVAVAVALYSGVAFLDGGLAQPTRAMFDRLWAVFDNRIPEQFAVNIVDGRPVHGFVQVGWHFSDRPPLQSAMLVPQYVLFGDRDLGYQFAATALQATFVIGTWALLRSIGTRVFATAAAIALILPTGVLFFNSVYVWPKLLAATFVLLAVALVFAPVGDRGSPRHTLRLALIAGAALLATLAHGSSMYPLLALVPFAIVRLGLTRHVGRSLLVLMAAFLVLYAPWSAFQKYEDPPSNRLAKWHLANVIDPSDQRSTLTAMLDSYGNAGVEGTIRNKLDNITTLVWRDDYAGVAATWGWHGWISDVRIVQQELFLPSMLPLGLVTLVLATRRGRRAAARMGPIAGWIAAALLVWCLLEFGGHPPSRTVVHNGSLAPLVAALGLCALLAVRFDRRLAWLMAGGQVLAFGVVWVDGLRGQAANPAPTVLGTFDPAAAVLVVLAVAGVASTLAILRHRERSAIGSRVDVQAGGL